MDRLTEYHCGVAVIKDKNKLKEAMAKLDRYEDMEIKAEPFAWNDNFSEIALEDFSKIQKDLPYCISQNIGMALAKLELLEKQGCEVEDEYGRLL